MQFIKRIKRQQKMNQRLANSVNDALANERVSIIRKQMNSMFLE